MEIIGLEEKGTELEEQFLIYCMRMEQKEELLTVKVVDKPTKSLLDMEGKILILLKKQVNENIIIDI